MGMSLVVGCPVTNRAWVLPAWFEFTEKACAEIGVEPTYVFVYGTSEDRTLDILRRHTYGRTVWIDEVEEDAHDGHSRVWNEERYPYMVEIRNRLLRNVRSLNPDYFLSLDSDILLAKRALPNLLESAQKYDAVGGKCYMQHYGNAAPSNGMVHDYTKGLIRYDGSDVFMTMVIMAIKLMSPAAYNIDYIFDANGEDIGWSSQCILKGLKLGWDGRICSKHIMKPEMLYTVDKRCGY